MSDNKELKVMEKQEVASPAEQTKPGTGVYPECGYILKPIGPLPCWWTCRV